MDKNAILYWRNRYDKDEPQKWAQIERELGIEFRKYGCVYKQDLEKLFPWKFRNDPLKLAIANNHLNKANDDTIQSKSRQAFEVSPSDDDCDERRLRLLHEMKCFVGYSVGSVILAFYDPQQYGIFDTHSWGELTNSGIAPKNLFATNKIHYVLNFLAQLREKADETGLGCREVEKAYFKKHLVECKTDSIYEVDEDARPVDDIDVSSPEDDPTKEGSAQKSDEEAEGDVDTKGLLDRPEDISANILVLKSEVRMLLETTQLLREEIKTTNDSIQSILAIVQHDQKVSLVGNALEKSVKKLLKRINREQSTASEG
jgi:hypothetical protein